jgi:hypothetical protein
MITINLKEAREIIEAEKNRPKIKRVINLTPGPSPKVEGKPHPQIIPTPPRSEVKSTLQAQCWAEFNDLKIEQGKVSNTIGDVVASGATRAQLQELYAKIESYRPDLIRLFERARYVDQYGVLPEEKTAAQLPADIYGLKDQKRKLVDLRHKLSKKISTAKREDQRLDWEQKLALANTEYAVVDEQIKKMEGK